MNDFTMRKIVFPVMLMLCSHLLMAQQASPEPGKRNRSGNIAVAAGAALPLGAFADTHWGGIGVSGSSASVQVAFFHPYKLRFAWSGGGVYFFGKNETPAGYHYTYPGYISLYGMAGVMYSPFHKAVVNMLAGPAIGLYDGTTRFNLSLRADVDFYVTKKWAISPGFMLLKESGADPLPSASLRVLFIPGN